MVDAIPIAGIKQALTVIRRVSHNLQDRGMIKIIFGSPIFSIFQWNSFGNEEKNTTFAHEKSVLLISAEHCRIEKLAGFLIVTCQADNICKFLVFNG